jgi:hypothetical protein
MSGRPKSDAVSRLISMLGGSGVYSHLSDAIPSYDEMRTLHEQQRQQWQIPEHQYFNEPVSIFGPRQGYEHLAALRGGMQTGLDDISGEIHGESRYKWDDHPNRFVAPSGMGLIDSKYGMPWSYRPGSPDFDLIMRNMRQKFWPDD